MRRIPIGGDGGANKTWKEMLVHYEQEIENLKNNITMLKDKETGKILDEKASIKSLTPASVKIINGLKPFTLSEKAPLFSNLPACKINAIAPELKGLQAYSFDGDAQRNEGTSVEFETENPVSLLIGYYRDDHRKYARAPRLETDATANDYGQAEPVLVNAIRLDNLPLVNVHAYKFPAGKHKLLLPKGYLSVLGFTNDEIAVRNAALAGTEETVDWLFY